VHSEGVVHWIAASAANKQVYVALPANTAYRDPFGDDCAGMRGSVQRVSGKLFCHSAPPLTFNDVDVSVNAKVTPPRS
jgi:hypothetical protein